MLPPGAGSAKRGFVENQEISKGSPEVYQISWGMSGEIFVRLGKELRVSREDFESEQDAPTTAWGETLQLRWVDERPDFLACFVFRRIPVQKIGLGDRSCLVGMGEMTAESFMAESFFEEVKNEMT